MTFDEILEQKEKETNDLLRPFYNDFKEEMDAITEDHNRWFNDSVRSEFGEFLYKALGNVNGTKQTTDIGGPTELDYFDKRRHGRSIDPYEIDRRINGFVTGKQFGFKLQGYKSKTAVIDAGDLLTMLAPEHVAMIKAKKKRDMVADFYRFKKAYNVNWNKTVDDLNGQVFQVNIPVKLANTYRTSVEHFKAITIIDGVQDGTVTGIWFEGLNHNRRVDYEKDQIHSEYMRGKYCDNHSVLVKMHMQGVRANETGVVNLGFMAFNFKVNKENRRKPFEEHTPPLNNKSILNILNRGEVLRDEVVREQVYKIINHKKGVAKSLEWLRLKYAKYLILNGEF